MIAKTAGRADDDMRAIGERPALLAHVHAPDAGRHFAARRRIEPFEFVAHLNRQFARGRDNDSQGVGACGEAIIPSQQGRSHGKTESHRLARSRLRGNEKIGLADIWREDGALHFGQRGVALFCKRLREELRRPIDSRHVKRFRVPNSEAVKRYVVYP